MDGLDKLHFFLHKLRNSSRNKKFIQENPDIQLPPAYTLYEAYRLDYGHYFEDGKKTAEWLAKELSDYLPQQQNKILDWGCGPARVVRHLPIFLKDSDIYGSDYNEETIQWCKENISGVNFSVNSINPPLTYQENFFNAIYALSVFTHLSEKNHYTWIRELYRILKPGGVLLITTQGNSFTGKLSSAEKEIFDKGRIVVRGKVKEGHRTFSAFHPEKFMLSFFSADWKLLKLINGSVQEWGPEQDLWIVQKK